MLKERITLKLKEMTAGQSAVARFLLDHPKEAAFITASQLGERVGVSETTVIRLSHLLGYSGYLQLRTEMKSRLMDHLSTLERIKDYGTSPKNDIYERALRKDMDTLSAAISSVPSEELAALGKAAAEAEAVYLAGYRSSFALASYLSFYLSWILPNVHTIKTDIPYETLMNAPKGSLVIGISFPRYSRWTLDVLGIAEEFSLETAAVTNDLTSPLAARAKYVLTAPYRHVSFIDSFAAPISILNCLILAVAGTLGQTVADRLESLEKHWKEEGIYVSQRQRGTS
jgi:DNA-binding MurR/RpiR family transcriptional regulator